MQWPFRVFIRQPLPKMVVGWAEIVSERYAGFWSVGQIYVTDGAIVRQADFDERSAVTAQMHEFGPQIGRAYRKSLEVSHELH